MSVSTIARADLVLHGEDVLQLPVEPVGPEVIAGAHVHELRRHAQPLPGLPHAPFEHGADAELAADLPHVGVLAPVGEGAGARRDVERRDLRQGVQDLLGHPVAEVLGVRVRAHVAKRQHGDRRGLLGNRRGAARGGRHFVALAETERERQIARRLKALVGALLETVADDLDELGRQGAAALAKMRRLLVEDRHHRLDRRGALEGAATRQHLVEDGAEGEDVGAVVGRLAAHLLGRHVTDGAEHHAGLRGAGRDPRLGSRRAEGHHPRQAEVEDLDPPVARDEDVFGLHVPMHDPLLVRGRETLGHPAGELHRLALRERSSRQPRAHRLALEQLRHGVRDPAVVAEVEDGQDVRVRERGDRLGLPLEALQGGRVPRQVGRQDLQRHVAVELRVARPVDLAHAADAERREDLVGAQAGTDT